MYNSRETDINITQPSTPDEWCSFLNEQYKLMQEDEPGGIFI